MTGRAMIVWCTGERRWQQQQQQAADDRYYPSYYGDLPGGRGDKHYNQRASIDPYATLTPSERLANNNAGKSVACCSSCSFVVCCVVVECYVCCLPTSLSLTGQ